MTTTQILGFVATGLVIVGYIPQIVHLIKERCTAGISISAFSLWCTASLLFLVHAAMIGDAVFRWSPDRESRGRGAHRGVLQAVRGRGVPVSPGRVFPGSVIAAQQAASKSHRSRPIRTASAPSRPSPAFQNDTNIQE